VTDNLLDLALLLEVSKSLAGQAAVDLQTIDESGDGDEAVRLNVLVKTLSYTLLEDNGVLGLVLNCCRKKKKPRQFIAPLALIVSIPTTPLSTQIALTSCSEKGSFDERMEGLDWRW
jgi:hypothetical protein